VNEESLFREVDEEVRQEQYQKLWDRFGNLAMAAAVAVVAVVAGIKGWQYYQVKQSEDAAAVYFDAVKKAQDGKLDDATAAFAAVKHPGYLQLAGLEKAGLLAANGKVKDAVAMYDAFAADVNHDAALADVARIRAGYLLADTAKPDELLVRLGKFDKDDQVWRHAAREIFGIAAWRSGDFVMADRYMNALFADAETPASMRQRVQVMLQLLTPKLPKK
jgi:hypothetical protein